ncbi:MAG: peptidase domain protein [Gemmatimonadetes bacterium]|nr:peptidase domain protein [Gemmatimonadota bacterium]
MTASSSLASLAPLSSIDPASVIRTRLANGLTVLVRRDRSAPVVAIVTYVSAGYFDETDDIVGIAHVLEHMYFKGTPSRGVGEIAKQTKAVGGYLNAGTIYDHTSYYTVLPSSGFIQGLDVQADAYARSIIDAEELARELEVIIQEAKRKADNPPAVATETLYELLHDRHRIRRWRIGREPGLREITRDALWSFYKNYYHPGNTVLSIVGDVDPEVALAEVEKKYGGLPPGEPARHHGPTEEGVSGFRYREWSGDILQTQVAFGWRTPGTTHPDTPALDLLATVMGSGRASRLYRAVRERRLASSISAYNYTPTDIGVFVVHGETQPASAADAARAVWDQLRAVRDGDVADLGELEIERAKRIYESQFVRRLEDMEGQANYLAEWEALGDWRMGERYLERLMSATRDDLVAVANRYLDPDNAGVVVYRPESSAPIAESPDAMRKFLDAAPHPAPLAPPVPYQAHVLPSAPPAVFEREEDGVRVYRTATGVPIAIRNKPGAPLLHAGVFALGGASEEPADLAGLTTLMARTTLKGTTTRSALQIAEEGEMLGGSVGAAVGSESFGWSVSVPARYAAAAIELLADVVQNPTFDIEALETERSIAIADVVTLRDDMYRYPMRLATQAAFAGHPYGVPASGTEETLRRIDAAAVREWHANRALTSASVIALVGAADPDELAQLAARAFGTLRHAEPRQLPAPSWPTGLTTTAESRDRAQTALTLLFPGPARNDEARYAAAMIASVASGLGGRFFDELRDKRSLCYTVNAFASDRRLAGTFGAYIATGPEQENAAREGLLAEFRRLREEPVTDEELERAKQYAIGTHAIRQQSGGAVLGDLVDAFLFGSLRELAEYDARVSAVTAGAMMDVAGKYFDPSRRVEGIVRGKALRAV